MEGWKPERMALSGELVPEMTADRDPAAAEQDWECAQQASVLAEVAQAFESDEGVSDGEGDRVTLFSSVTQLSPSGQADAETLTVMLQEQLDTINEEIRVPDSQWKRLEALTCISALRAGELPALRKEVGDDKTAIKCETSTPTSPRSLWLDRLHTGALCTATHEDIRDAHNSTGSQDNPGNNPSSSTSRQDSLHKAPKKKGINQVLHQPLVLQEGKGPA
ncbi:hypothetical protein E5288_WYG000941 [Bos mutus]|uniref:Uncharacterized protein n=1 Tax=Bos mutus TaxID=72004 RepID=A0A6B0SHL7_9CETA|nr:hypothetical protein [Bos mutus]